jgi:hypothetical protein
LILLLLVWRVLDGKRESFPIVVWSLGALTPLPAINIGWPVPADQSKVVIFFVKSKHTKSLITCAYLEQMVKKIKIWKKYVSKLELKTPANWNQTLARARKPNR